MGKRECAESCIDYLTLELVNHYRQQQQGPTLQVRVRDPACLPAGQPYATPPPQAIVLLC